MTPTLVILAAGMSTRFGRSKQLEPVGPNGETLLDYGVFDAWRAGISRTLLVIREELEDAFREYLVGRWPPNMEVVFHHQRLEELPGAQGLLRDSPGVAGAVEDRRKPWGTAHALLTARRHLPGPFVVLNADDFYGAEAFRHAVEFLGSGEPGKTAGEDDGASTGRRGRPHPAQGGGVPVFGLVTYALGDTLSEHGGVSRGIVEVNEEGWMTGVREVLEIMETTGGVEGRGLGGERVELTGGEAISTNFWLFTPEVFPLLEAELAAFLAAAGERWTVYPEAQPEFLIPTVVNEALAEGQARVRAIPTDGTFLGITHPSDRPRVVEGLNRMTEGGHYPSPLWS